MMTNLQHSPLRAGMSARTQSGRHHPMVRSAGANRWCWTCECGAAHRASAEQGTWRVAVISALVHQGSVAGA